MSDLTDLELCKRIAEIEGWRYCAMHNYVRIDKDSYKAEYNPLTDDALCFKLMIKHDVNIDRYHDSAFILSEYTDRPHKANVSFAIDMNVNRAILLAIVEANS